MYDRSITEIKPPSGVRERELIAGDLGVVFDKKRRFAAIGLYDPNSPLRLRILHQGSPRTIDGSFWRHRLQAALDQRQSLLRRSDSSGWRWVNGENDELPGLVVDCYGQTLVVKLDTGAWLPHLAAVLTEAVDLRTVDSVVLRLSRSVQVTVPELADGSVLLGDVAGEIPFLENGIPLTADVIRGQKTGYFLDQRANRQRVAELAPGQDVLDMFCCTGGFTVAALAAGARSVHAVDRSTHAIETVKRHAGALEGAAGDPARLTTSASDAFDDLERLNHAGRQFGVVVVDPPSFASSAKDVAGAHRAYRRLTELAAPLVAAGGWLVQASCTSRVEADVFTRDVVATLGSASRRIIAQEVSGHDVDHPIGFPEGAYLKCVFAQLA